MSFNAPADSVSAPSFTWSSETTTGFYKLASSGATGYSAAGTDVFRMTSSSIRFMPTGSGYGIQFQGRTGVSNTLDDYEEGTWTPVIADASTAGVSATGTFAGIYVKIARVVIATFSAVNITTTGMTAGNNIFIRGLPHAIDNITPDFIAPVQLAGLASTTIPSTTAILKGAGNASYMRITSATTGAQSYMTVAALTSGAADIWGTITYFTTT